MWLVFSNVMNAPPAAAGSGFVGYLLALPMLGKVLFVTFLARRDRHPDLVVEGRAPRTEFQMMLAAIILVVFNVTFWTLFEQAASSLTLFADRNTDAVAVRLPHLGRADAELQPDHHRDLRADRELAVARRSPRRDSSRRSRSSSASR